MWTLDKPMASLSVAIYGVSWMAILLNLLLYLCDGVDLAQRLNLIRRVKLFVLHGGAPHVSTHIHVRVIYYWLL